MHYTVVLNPTLAGVGASAVGLARRDWLLGAKFENVLPRSTATDQAPIDPRPGVAGFSSLLQSPPCMSYRCTEYMPDTADMYPCTYNLELRYGLMVMPMRPCSWSSALAPPPPRGGAADNGPD